MNLIDMTIAQLLGVHNTVADKAGKPVLASWKSSKHGLVARIELLQDTSAPKVIPPVAAPVTVLPEVLPVAEQPATVKEEKMSAKKAVAKKAVAKKAVAKKAVAKKAATERKPGIGSFILERCAAGDDNKTILEKAAAKGFNTTYGSIASVRSRQFNKK